METDAFKDLPKEFINFDWHKVEMYKYDMETMSKYRLSYLSLPIFHYGYDSVLGYF